MKAQEGTTGDIKEKHKGDGYRTIKADLTIPLVLVQQAVLAPWETKAKGSTVHYGQGTLHGESFL